MENSENPQTSQYSERIGKQLDAPPEFRNLVVISAREPS
jgi:hypothetical protein